jgi:hypothetical protein
MASLIHIDDNQNCTFSHSCEACSEWVREGDHCGNDGQYLCSDCYGKQTADERYIHDWLIMLVDFDWTPDVLVAIHKDVATMKAIDAADHSVPDPEDNISRFGPGTCAHTLEMDDMDGLHADVNAVYCLIDSGLIDGKRALKMFRDGGAA